MTNKKSEQISNCSVNSGREKSNRWVYKKDYWKRRKVITKVGRESTSLRWFSGNSRNWTAWLPARNTKDVDETEQRANVWITGLLKVFKQIEYKQLLKNSQEKFMSRSRIQIEKNHCVPDKSMNKGTHNDVSWQQV